MSRTYRKPIDTETAFLAYWRAIRAALAAHGHADIVCGIADAKAFRAGEYEPATAAYELITRIAA